MPMRQITVIEASCDVCAADGGMYGSYGDAADALTRDGWTITPGSVRCFGCSVIPPRSGSVLGSVS